MLKNIKRLTSGFLITTLLLTGCSSGALSVSTAASPDVSNEEATHKEAAAFSRFTNEIFVDTVSSDALTLHYNLIDPSAYNITLDTIDFGRTDKVPDKAADLKEINDLMDRLHSFNYDYLNDSQQTTYTMLEGYLQTELDYLKDESDLYYYEEPLTSLSGIQTLLPMLMAEYTFYNENDIQTYLKLLDDFPGYFENILDFEKAKSDAGLFMSDESLSEVITSCESFIADPDNNLLITTFAGQLENVATLDDKTIETYTAQNKKAVRESVMPAYEQLIDGLNDLKGTGKNENGLYYYDNGKTYYDYLIKTQVGTDKTADELIDMIDSKMTTDMTALAMLVSSDDALYNGLSEDTDINMSDPDEILQTLQKDLLDYFPKPVTGKYTLNHVDPALEDSTNPAFYIVPPADAPEKNIIYLNDSLISDNMSLFTTLAHEGYPGHLYQTSYFSSKNSDSLRHVITYSGYVEGWATYVENISYTWLGLDAKLAKCLQLNNELTLCIYSRVDLGIHYEGWKESDVAEFLTTYGFGDAETVHSIFRIIVTDPASYLPYTMGLLLIEDLRDTAENELGDKFDLKEFHTFLLDMGPCSFTMIEEAMDEWMEAQ